LQVRPNVRIFANNTGKQVTTKGYTEHEEQIARFAKAMGHPARMAILRFLASQQSCFFGEIHEVLPIAKATVSQHLKELKEAGLIQGEIEAPKVRYCINRSNWLLARDLFAEFFREGHTDGRPHDSCCG
jgi:ArsR family transcriptional regulator